MLGCKDVMKEYVPGMSYRFTIGMPDWTMALYFLRGNQSGEKINNSRKVYSHIAHGDHVVDLLDTKPVEDVGHESLETHVLHASDELRRREVLVGGVATAFAEVVHEVSGTEVRLQRSERTQEYARRTW